MRHLLTIGYEGATPAAFDETLADASVRMVVDLRAVAISRRAGFSKSVLRDRLNAQRIGYVHLRALGDPKPGREAAREGRFTAFEAIYRDHLAGSEAQLALLELQALAQRERVAVLCYEADAQHCHRTIVAVEVAKREKMRLTHLRVAIGEKVARTSRASDCTYQGVAAA